MWLMLLWGQHYLSTSKSRPSIDYFPGLCSNTCKSHQCGWAYKPWDSPIWKYNKEASTRNTKKKAILLFIATLKTILTLAGSFCCHVLAHIYLWLVARVWMFGDVISGEELQNSYRSIRIEDKENLLNGALDFPADCVSVAHLLSPCVHGGK